MRRKHLQTRQVFPFIRPPRAIASNPRRTAAYAPVCVHAHFLSPSTSVRSSRSVCDTRAYSRKKNEYRRFWEAPSDSADRYVIGRLASGVDISFVNFYTCSRLFIRVYRVNKNPCRPSRGRESDFGIYIYRSTWYHKNFSPTDKRTRSAELRFSTDTITSGWIIRIRIKCMKQAWKYRARYCHVYRSSWSKESS